MSSNPTQQQFSESSTVATKATSPTISVRKNLTLDLPKPSSNRISNANNSSSSNTTSGGQCFHKGSSISGGANSTTTNTSINMSLQLSGIVLSHNHNNNNTTTTPDPLSSLIKVDAAELMKVDTPTIENIILANNMTTTPSPSMLFPRNVTAEQETFVGGFVEALNNLHNSGNGSDSNASSGVVYETTSAAGPPPPTSGAASVAAFLPHLLTASSASNITTTTAATVKEEPNQIVPGSGSVSPPMSPVDMKNQEMMKLERKRQRNRLAASKCRSRKLERISKLEDKVRILKNDNVDLASTLNQLKETVGLLKLEVMQHVNAGCPIIQHY